MDKLEPSALRMRGSTTGPIRAGTHSSRTRFGPARSARAARQITAHLCQPVTRFAVGTAVSATNEPSGCGPRSSPMLTRVLGAGHHTTPIADRRSPSLVESFFARFVRWFPYSFIVLPMAPNHPRRWIGLANRRAGRSVLASTSDRDAVALGSRGVAMNWLGTSPPRSEAESTRDVVTPGSAQRPW